MWVRFLLILCITFSACLPASCQNKDKKLENSQKMANKSYAGSTNAPDFPKGLQWYNTSTPLRLEDLKGKIVLLDFWTYCCINCIHILPDLKKLEHEFPELVVIGVHSAKFDNEKDAENVRQAVLRYDIEHPVISDTEFYLWRQYGVSAWPSFVLLDPNGKYVGQTSGEGVYEKLKPYIQGLSDEFAQAGKLNKIPLRFALEREKRTASYLSFPGKITADTNKNRLFFTDSNHNRIIVCDTNGNIEEIIGSGMEGSADGDFSQAQFFRPQGLVYDPEVDALYVADTENHLIRKVDLTKKNVLTLAGTGAQARTYLKSGVGKSIALNSPWDLELWKGKLYIAMAGPHQIWEMDLQTMALEVYAGSGHENIVDGPRKVAALAQPSGITTDGQALYFADSEISALRAVDAQQVKTFIGEGLFEFGDVDGKYPTARLQHAIGCHYHNGKIYIADTYNHKIKVYDLAQKQLQTLIGTGKRGLKNGKRTLAELNEPNDLVALAGKFYITDTNNDLIRVYDPATETLSTLALKPHPKLSMLNLRMAQPTASNVPFFGEVVRLGNISPQQPDLQLRIELPDGYELNEDAPHFVETLQKQKAELSLEKNQLTAKIKLQGNYQGADKLSIQAGIYYCAKAEKARCLIKFYTFEIPLGGTPSNAPTVLHYKLSAQ